MPYDTAKAAGMHNTEGINVDLYIPRKWYAVAAACRPAPIGAQRRDA